MNKVYRGKKIVNLVRKELESEENGQYRDNIRSRDLYFCGRKKRKAGAVDIHVQSSKKITYSSLKRGGGSKEQLPQIVPQESADKGAVSDMPMLEPCEGELVALTPVTVHQKPSEPGGKSEEQPPQCALQESSDKGAVTDMPMLETCEGELVALTPVTDHQKPSEPGGKTEEQSPQCALQESSDKGAVSDMPMLETCEGELVALTPFTVHQKPSEPGGKSEEQPPQFALQESLDKGAVSDMPMLETCEGELVALTPVTVHQKPFEPGSDFQEQPLPIEPEGSTDLATNSAASLVVEHHNNGPEFQPDIEVENDMNSANIVPENEINKGEGLPFTGRQSRKRLRDPEKWKKNRKKSLKNTGQAYKTVTGITVPAKELKSPCGEKCRLKCSQKIDEQNRKQLFNNFWKIGDLERQRLYLHKCMLSIKPKYSLHNENSKRSLNVAYYFNINSEQIRVYKKFFTATLNIGHSFLSTVNKKVGPTGVIAEEGRGKHDNLKKLMAENDKDAVREHINSYPRKESHYCRASSSKTYLDGDLNLSMMYRQYKEWCHLKNKPIVKQWAYDHIFQSEFNISFHKPKKDQCSLCLSYNNAVAENKAKLSDNYYRHLKEKELCRQEKKADIEFCKNDGNKIVCCFDMQAVLQTPSGNDSLFFYKRRLNVYNCTVYEIVTKQAHCYLWNESLGGKGCDEVGTCILKFLENHAAGKHVIFYTDNCAAQNKNKYLMSLYYYAMKELNVKSITHKYLIVGHTQNEGDSVHSTIEREKTRILKNGSIFVPSQRVSVIQCAKKKGTPYQVHELDYTDIIDSKDLLTQYGKNFTLNTDGDRVIWNDIKKIFMQLSSPHLIFYHDTYEPNATMKIIDVRQKVRRMAITELHLRKKYHERPKISNLKKKDLIALCDSNVIPRVYREYYCTLEATNNRLPDGEDDD